MWIGIGIAILIIVLLLFLISRPSKSKKSEVQEKKVYAMPKQRRYPWFYIKDCRFHADSSSRFTYSENELEHLNNSLQENIKKEEYIKAIKISEEILKVSPQKEEVWIDKINCIFLDVIKNEKCWEEFLSKRIVNACWGFLQCTDNVLDKSLSVKHKLVPTILKNVEELIKYQNKNVTKYHNFDVYNMLMNIYHIIPFKDILELLSNHILEDKFDKEFENEAYPRVTIKSFLNHVDMLRTRNTSRLQETFDVGKITNCTLINDEKMEANIIAFDLNFSSGNTSEKIQARFFDEDDKEIIFGKNKEDTFIDVFESNASKGSTVREEIVILTDIRIAKVVVSIYKDEADSDEVSENEKLNINTENNSKKSDNEDIQADEDNIEMDEDTLYQTIMYPSFENIEDIKISNSQFVCLKNDGLVLAIGEGNCAEQISTWKEINKIYVKDNAIYAIRNDGTVIFAGETDYQNAEYIYAWENVNALYLAEKHMLALTNNHTVKAIGNNDNGQCEVDEWYDILSVAVAFHSVGLAKDGKVYAIGENNFGECDVESWQDIVQIAAGNFYTVGLMSSGKVVATGLNSCGQCNVSDWTNIKEIFAYGNMTIGLRYDGRVVTTGKSSYRVDDVKKWNAIKSIIIVDNRIIGIDQDGVVYAAGKPYRNFVNNSWNDVKKVVSSGENIVGLKSDGKLLSNGLLFGHFLSNDFGNMIQICETIQGNKTAMLNKDNVLTCMNKNHSSKEDGTYPTIYEVKAADISATHLVALKMDGTVCAFNFEDKVLTNISEWDSIVDVKAGNNFIVGLNINGKVVAVGDNSYGQCNVDAWSDIVMIEAAGDRTIGVTIDGKILTAGKNEAGEFDFLNTLNSVKSVAMTDFQTMVLQNDGTVKLSFNPSGTGVEEVQKWKNVKKIVARENNFLGLKVDGTIFSTLENEAEISKWNNIDDIFASGSYTWARLKF